jgi:hypothetical protein
MFFTVLAWPARATAKVLNDLANTTTEAVSSGDPDLEGLNAGLAASILTVIYGSWAVAAVATIYLVFAFAAR